MPQKLTTTACCIQEESYSIDVSLSLIDGVFCTDDCV